METAFNKYAIDYSRARPGYPEELYHHVSKHKEFGPSSEILEIGAGPGTATAEVNALWHPEITALEPGKNLYETAKRQFQNSRNIHFIHSTFEAYKTSRKFDGIFAATSFHWLNPEVKFIKTFNLLKDEGLFFAFWNYFPILEENILKDIQNIYTSFHPQGGVNNKVRSVIRNKIETRKNEINNSPYFRLAEHLEIENPLPFTADQYISLLKTFPGNNLSGALIDPFFREIKKYILKRNNKITVNITVCLDIARKRRSC